MTRRLFVRAYAVNEWMVEHDHRLPDRAVRLWAALFDWACGVPLRTLRQERRDTR